MESVGKAHSCPSAHTQTTKLQLRRCLVLSGETECVAIDNDIVGAGIDDEAIEVQHTRLVAVGRGPTKLETEHHVATGHAQHRTWCDAFMRARGIAGRHEKPQSGREDEGPLVAMDFGYLKLVGTEDYDDDEAFGKSPAARGESQTKETRTNFEYVPGWSWMHICQDNWFQWKSLHPNMRVRLNANTEKLCMSLSKKDSTNAKPLLANTFSSVLATKKND